MNVFWKTFSARKKASARQGYEGTLAGLGFTDAYQHWKFAKTQAKARSKTQLSQKSLFGIQENVKPLKRQEVKTTVKAG